MQLVGRGNGIEGSTWETQLRTSRLEIIFAWSLWNSFKLVHSRNKRPHSLLTNLIGWLPILNDPWSRLLLAQLIVLFWLGIKRTSRRCFLVGIDPVTWGQVKVPEILHFRNNDGLLFNHVWGKTLRDGDSNIFGIQRNPQSKLCPVQGIEQYLAISDQLKVDLRTVAPNRKAFFLICPHVGVTVHFSEIIRPKYGKKSAD